jgi:hypothetical protein
MEIHKIDTWTTMSRPTLVASGSANHWIGDGCKNPERKKKFFSPIFLLNESSSVLSFRGRDFYAEDREDRCYDYSNIFAEFFCEKSAFLTRNKAKFGKKLTITLVFEKNVIFFAENCDHNIDPLTA